MNKIFYGFLWIGSPIPCLRLFMLAAGAFLLDMRFFLFYVRFSQYVTFVVNVNVNICKYVYCACPRYCVRTVPTVRYGTL